MRNNLFLLAFLLLSTISVAQTDSDYTVSAVQTMPTASAPRFGYLSYSALMTELPSYSEAQNKIAQLRENYKKEIERSQKDFNAKYEEFLSEQQSLMPSIRRKRQVELEELLDGNKAFREEAMRLLQQAEADIMKPVRSELNSRIQAVAMQLGLAFVLNTDGDACPFINPEMGVDISQAVLNQK